MKNSALFSLTLLFLLSCGHAPPELHKDPAASEKIAKFVDEYSAQYLKVTPEHKAFVTTYEKYLQDIHGLYTSSGHEKDFDLYLNSLRNNQQIIANAKFNLPQRYKREKRKRADLRSRDFQLYQTKVITSLYDRLNQERIGKLKSSVNAEFFSQLMAKNRQYNERRKSKNPEFFFPL